MVVSIGLKNLYSFLYKKYVNHNTVFLTQAKRKGKERDGKRRRIGERERERERE
jgi:hypothetical protein